MQPEVRKQIKSRRAQRVKPWHWLMLGTGTGLVLVAAAATAFRWMNWEEETDADPRAEQVQELLKEAERLLAHGKRSDKE